MSLAAKANAKIAVKTFDYEGIDPEAKSKLIYLASEVHKATSTHVESAIRLGESLATAQAVLTAAGRKGRFAEWIDKECGFSKSTAYNYIAAFTRFNSELENVGKFTMGAVFALSPEKVPQIAVDEALKAAKKGVRINRERAQEILERFRAVKKPETAKIPENKSSNALEKSTSESGYEQAETGGGEEVDFEPAKLDSQPKPLVDIAGLAAPYKQWVLELGAIINGVKRLSAEERTGGHLATKEARIVHDLSEAKVAISEAEPVRVCPKCDGAGCHPCSHTGFWTRAILKSRK